MTKGDYFEITVTEKRKYKVSFDELVTFQEANELFLAGDQGDINDEEPIEIISIEKCVMIG